MTDHSEAAALPAVFETAVVPSFEDEDNNPFSHTLGLTSMIHDQANSGEGGHEGDIEDSILLYKTSKSEPASESKGSGLIGHGGGPRGRAAGADNVINYESRVTKLLRPNCKVRVQITEASNSNEGVMNSLKKYVVYTIRLSRDRGSGEEGAGGDEEDVQTRRRYSDFESLREVLTKIFPLVIVPPIPPKNYFNLNVLNGLVQLHQLQPLVGGGSRANMAESSVSGAEGAAGGGGSNANGDSSIQASSLYTYINSNHLSKHKLVEHRKRLLTNFLNNCLEISKIRNLEFFAKFLDPNANWSDEVALISSQLPKSVYQLNPENGLQTDPIYANLPLPVSSHGIASFLKPLKRKVSGATSSIASAASGVGGNSPPYADEEDLGLSVEDVTAETLSPTDRIDTTALDDINKRIMENFIGLSNDYTELGSIFNSFSLVLTDTSRELKKTSASNIKLNLIFDNVGQLFDRSYITLNSLIGDLETKFSEPLGEAVRFSRTLQTISKFKERKLRQSRLLDTEVGDKKLEFNNLISYEEEANRLEHTGNGLAKNTKYDLTNSSGGSGSGSGSAGAQNGTSSSGIKNGKYRMMPMFKKLTQYVSEIIDQNPEETRKQRLKTLSTKIEILEKCQTRMLEDIAYITGEINDNFKSFKRIQLKIIYEILLCYNGFLVDWAKKNVEIWEDIRDEVKKL